MKIAVTGDTHGSVQALRKIVQLLPPVDLLLHTGDHAADANFLQSLTGIKVVAVRGNCDINEKNAELDSFLELEDFKLWLTHGHKYIQWNDKADMSYWGRQLEQDVVVYGHTHVPVCEQQDGLLLLNPGSPARPRGGSKPCFAVLDLQAGKPPAAEFIEIK